MSNLNLSAITAAFVLACSTGSVAAQGMTRDEFKAAGKGIDADFKAARAGCDAKAANAKDICVAEARGKERIAKAELAARNKPGERTRYNVSVAKAEADYAIAKEKCDEKTGNDRSACVKEARAAQALAKTDARGQMPTANQPGGDKSAMAAPKKESVGKYVDDSVITAKVKGEVLKEPSLKSAEINVETYKGVVQLSGFVRSRADIDKAVMVARSVKGATSVKNDMIVKGQQ